MSNKQCINMIIVGMLIYTLSRYGAEGLWRLVGIAVAICGLGVLVLVHELGHFLGGRISKMAIESFQIGFGQPLFTKLWGETEWKICALPLGGAVKFTSENGENESRADYSLVPGRESLMDKSRWFNNRPWPLQMLTLAAGPAFSIAVAVPLLFLCITAFGIPDLSAAPLIQETVPGSPASTAELMKNDLVISIADRKVETAQEALDCFSKIDKETKIVVLRAGEKKEFSLTPVTLGKRRLFGIVFRTPNRSVDPKDALVKAFQLTGETITSQAQGIYWLVTGQISPKHISGPVGIINITGKAAQSGVQNLLFLLATITIGLGLSNLFPIPILDGGRMVILLLRQFIGKRAADYYEPAAYGAGLVVVLLIFLAVTVKDFLTL